MIGKDCGQIKSGWSHLNKSYLAIDYLAAISVLDEFEALQLLYFIVWNSIGFHFSFEWQRVAIFHTSWIKTLKSKFEVLNLTHDRVYIFTLFFFFFKHQRRKQYFVNGYDFWKKKLNATAARFKSKPVLSVGDSSCSLRLSHFIRVEFIYINIIFISIWTSLRVNPIKNIYLSYHF